MGRDLYVFPCLATPRDPFLSPLTYFENSYAHGSVDLNLAEVQIGIIAACGPTLRPVLALILPTEGIGSLMSLLRIGQSSSKGAEELPSFVRSPGSTSQLGALSIDHLHGKGTRYAEVETYPSAVRPDDCA